VAYNLEAHGDLPNEELLYDVPSGYTLASPEPEAKWTLPYSQSELDEADRQYDAAEAEADANSL
jgi:hypothetical protein